VILLWLTQASRPDPTLKGTFPVSNRVPIKTHTQPQRTFQYQQSLSRPRDYASIQQSQSIWQNEEIPFSSRKRRITKNFKKENSQKLKQKKSQSQCPVKTQDPQERNISYQDMMLPSNKGHGPVLCYRGIKEIKTLDVVL